MTNQLMDLKKIIDLDKWQMLQDSLAIITKMAIITVDYKGVPVTKHSLCTPFCVEIRKDPELFQYCKKCDARGGLEAVRLNEPYIYYCHCHIIDLAIPITVQDKYLGAIMAGQVRLADDVDLEQILTVTGKPYERKCSALAGLYYDMPTLSFSEVQLIAEMLHRLANYIVEEAIDKNMLLSQYDLASAPTKSANPPRHKLSNTLLNSHIKSDLSLPEQNYANPTLKPIFKYINENKSENIPLKKASAMCHISTSHFSRLFAKETGANYSNFLTQLKVNWSKQLLAETTLSITQISEELGYNDTGYFIKTFKKYEGVTPLLYRKYYNQ